MTLSQFLVTTAAKLETSDLALAKEMRDYATIAANLEMRAPAPIPPAALRRPKKKPVSKRRSTATT